MSVEGRSLNQLKSEDLEVLERRFSRDGDLLLEVLNSYEENVRTQIKGLREAVVEQNQKSLIYATHKLRGATLNFVWNSTVELLEKSELQASEGKPTELTEALVDFIGEDLQHLITQLRSLGQKWQQKGGEPVAGAAGLL